MWEKKTGRNLTGNWSELAQEERERDQERLRLMSFYSFFSSSPPFSPHSRTHGGSRRERKRLNSRVRTELRKELRRLRRQARDRDERRTLRRSLTFHELLRVQTCQPMYKFIDRNHLRYVCGIISTGRESDVYCVAGRPTTTTTEVSKEVGVDAGQGGERENGDDRSKGKGEEDEGEEQTKAGGNEDDRSSRTWNLYALKVYKKTAPVLAFDEGQGARPPHGYHRDDRPHPRIRNQRKVGMNQISIEYHNLLKLREAGMPCPLPIDLSCHVLLMSFAGVYTPHCMYSIAHPKQQSSKPLPLLKASRPNNEEVPFVSYPSSPSSSSSTCCSPSRRRSSDGVYTPEHAQSPFVRRYGKSVFLLHEKNGPQKRRKPPPRWRSVAVAPRLTDLSTSSTPLCCSSQAYMLYRAWCRLYVQAIACLRWMYQECQLVHGDFSEYNLLYYLQGLYVIDVGQAVHTAHPQALDFLKRDCRNVTSFFLNQIHHAKSQLFYLSRQEFLHGSRSYTSPRCCACSFSYFPFPTSASPDTIMSLSLSFLATRCGHRSHYSDDRFVALSLSDTEEESEEEETEEEGVCIIETNKNRDFNPVDILVALYSDNRYYRDCLRKIPNRHETEGIEQRDNFRTEFGWREEEEEMEEEKDEEMEEEEKDDENDGERSYADFRVLSLSCLLELITRPDLPHSIQKCFRELQQKQEERSEKEEEDRDGGCKAKKHRETKEGVEAETEEDGDGRDEGDGDMNLRKREEEDEQRVKKTREKHQEAQREGLEPRASNPFSSSSAHPSYLQRQFHELKRSRLCIHMRRGYNKIKIEKMNEEVPLPLKAPQSPSISLSLMRRRRTTLSLLAEAVGRSLSHRPLFQRSYQSYRWPRGFRTNEEEEQEEDEEDEEKDHVDDLEEEEEDDQQELCRIQQLVQEEKMKSEKKEERDQEDEEEEGERWTEKEGGRQKKQGGGVHKKIDEKKKKKRQEEKKKKKKEKKNRVPQQEADTSSSSSSLYVIFRGRIPEGVERKVWKRLVKEFNRRRRRRCKRLTTE